MDDDCNCPDGLPEYLATFADLMSLLMCFFVLLLSFAEIDAVRFKKMAESMKDAFGVQKEIPAAEIVMGVSVIKQEFSPTIGDPSVLNEIRQQTTDVDKQYLEMHDGESKADAAAQQVEQELEEQTRQLTEALEEEIDKGMVTVEREGEKIIVRIQEKGSFSSGSDRPQRGFFDVMRRISEVLAGRPGKIIVAGHTDNIPIHTRRFRSNWELSSARAVTVAEALLKNKKIDPKRLLIEGHADADPLVPNDSAENRSKNRRVELVLVRGDDGVAEQIISLGEDKR
ncbi:MAG TPA: type VI secretion system protein TssL [Chromatiaceae bacterium]|nr:type VI secretion system protein TssL [Chromatiaceae bacterium]